MREKGRRGRVMRDRIMWREGEPERRGRPDHRHVGEGDAGGRRQETAEGADR
jgi:hypothetical protein